MSWLTKLRVSRTMKPVNFKTKMATCIKKKSYFPGSFNYKDVSWSIIIKIQQLSSFSAIYELLRARNRDSKLAASSVLMSINKLKVNCFCSVQSKPNILQMTFMKRTPFDGYSFLKQRQFKTLNKFLFSIISCREVRSEVPVWETRYGD